MTYFHELPHGPQFGKTESKLPHPKYRRAPEVKLHQRSYVVIPFWFVGFIAYLRDGGRRECGINVMTRPKYSEKPVHCHITLMYWHLRWEASVVPPELLHGHLFSKLLFHSGIAIRPVIKFAQAQTSEIIGSH